MKKAPTFGTILAAFLTATTVQAQHGAFAARSDRADSPTFGQAHRIDGAGSSRSVQADDVETFTSNHPLSMSPAILSAEGDSLEVEFTLERDAPVTIELVAIGGGSAYRPIQGRHYPAGEQSEQIDIGALPAGSYLLRLSTPEGSSQQRIALGE